MKKYEYLTLEINTSDKIFSSGKISTTNLNEKLNVLGNDGWNLVETLSTTGAMGDILSYILIFKREA